MKEQIILAQVLPDYRRVMKDNKYPLKLKITWKGQRRYYGTSFSVTKKEWEILNSSEAKGKLKSIRNEIGIIETKAEKIAVQIVPFSFTSFQEQFFDAPIKYKSLRSVFEMVIGELRSEGRVGNALMYETTKVSLEKFRPGVKLGNITIDFLRDYEKWMTERKRSMTTLSMHLRTLRAIVNRAILDKQFNISAYPFGRNKYLIPKGNSNKRALSKGDLNKIFSYKTDSNDYFKRRSLDFWKFTYLANGINMMDIAQLRWKNIHEESILFSRAKTQRTIKKASTSIVIVRNHIIDRIIEDWGRKTVSDDLFVFKIIEEDDDPNTINKKVKQFIHVTNKHMKEIGLELGLKIPVTTYVARHSFSTMLLRSGASVAFISESLGHSDIKTTQSYLAGFDIEARKERMKALIDFG